MPYGVDQLLPSLTSLGMWTYWILALFALLEAVVLTGVLVPGAMAVIVGGMLAQQGVIDVFDLVWFIGFGTFIGSEISYRLGRLAIHGLSERPGVAGSRHIQRAAKFLRRYGGFAIIIGRFLGPMSAFVPFSAAMAGMSHRRFTAWNAASAVPYALILPAIGYFSGSALSTLGAAAPRILAFSAIVVSALALLVFVWRRTWRALPALVEIVISIASGLSRKPPIRRLINRHPRLMRLVAARFGTDQFLGLTATVLGVLLVYILGAYADSVYDFLGTQATVTSDTRIANLLYAMRDDQLITALGWITDVGGRHGVIPLLAGATIALSILRRFDLLGGLWIAATGNQITVMVLKSFFARPRSDLGYFVETSGSFPSGHAAGAIAVWSMLFYLAWRLRLLRADIAGLVALSVAILIGLSRVYLVEHYLSDVVNGYLVGGLWLILGVAFCEWRRSVPHMTQSTFRRGMASGFVVLASVVAIYAASTTASPLNPTAARATQTVSDPLTLLSETGLPVMTEVLSGAPRQGINLILTAPDVPTLTVQLEKSGWQSAPRPGLAVLAQAFFDDWTGRRLPQPLVIPTFWDNRPMTVGYAMPIATIGDDQRLHLRIWDSLFRTDGGQTVFVGTLTQEDPLEWDRDEVAMAATGPRVRVTLVAITAALREAGMDAAIP